MTSVVLQSLGNVRSLYLSLVLELPYIKNELMSIETCTALCMAVRFYQYVHQGFGAQKILAKMSEISVHSRLSIFRALQIRNTNAELLREQLTCQFIDKDPPLDSVSIQLTILITTHYRFSCAGACHAVYVDCLTEKPQGPMISHSRRARNSGQNPVARLVPSKGYI